MRSQAEPGNEERQCVPRRSLGTRSTRAEPGNEKYDGNEEYDIGHSVSGKMHGLPMGIAPCYTNHMKMDQDDQEVATML